MDVVLLLKHDTAALRISREQSTISSSEHWLGPFDSRTVGIFQVFRYYDDSHVYGNMATKRHKAKTDGGLRADDLQRTTEVCA